MPPASEFVPKSSLGLRPLANRGKPLELTTDQWLEDRKATDGAEGLWRIYDGIYDLSNFIHKHPGGADWLLLTKGTDITEAFEVHHFTEKPKEILKKYFIKNVTTKRNSPFSFEEDGFYKTLKREIEPIIKTVSKQSYNDSKLYADFLLVLTFTLSTLAVRYWSYGLGIIAGLVMGLMTVAGHNYFHQKDSFRMYYFQFSMLQVRDFRISHVLSHHLVTNSVNDLEISLFEPLMQYLPTEKKSLQKTLSLFIWPLMLMTYFHGSVIKKIIDSPKYNYENLRITDLSGLILPIFMYMFGGESFLSTFGMWNFILIPASFYVGFIGVNAGHHHPEVFHDGDTPRSKETFDWGLGQLDTLMERKEVMNNHFLVLTTFGDHALHHLFPTLDHSTLNLLYPALKKVLKKFDVDLRVVSQMDAVKGSLQQLLRVVPNPNIQNLKKYPKWD